MDLNIVLLTGGMLFTLSIFAVKVGFGLGFGGMKWKGISLTFSIYLALFVIIAILSELLIGILEHVLRKDPYLHILMAIGLITWGVYALKGISRKCDCDETPKGVLLLLIPCPVCLTAMTFSTWVALRAIKLPAYIVGLGLGITFVALSLLFYGFTRLKRSANPDIGLGLSMLVIGIYFLASLIFSAKIEEAKGIYGSFLTEGNNIDMNNGIGVFTLLFAALIIGYFANKRQEVKE